MLGCVSASRRERGGGNGRCGCRTRRNDSDPLLLAGQVRRCARGRPNGRRCRQARHLPGACRGRARSGRSASPRIGRSHRLKSSRRACIGRPDPPVPCYPYSRNCQSPARRSSVRRTVRSLPESDRRTIPIGMTDNRVAEGRRPLSQGTTDESYGRHSRQVERNRCRWNLLGSSPGIGPKPSPGSSVRVRVAGGAIFDPGVGKWTDAVEPHPLGAGRLKWGQSSQPAVSPDGSSLSILGLAASDGWAQAIQPPRPQPNPGPARAPDALAGDGRTPGRDADDRDRAPRCHTAVDPGGGDPADRPGLGPAPGERAEPRDERRPPAHHGGRRATATRRGLFPSLDQPRNELRHAYRQLAAVQRQYPVREPVCGLCGGRVPTPSPRERSRSPACTSRATWASASTGTWRRGKSCGSASSRRSRSATRCCSRWPRPTASCSAPRAGGRRGSRLATRRGSSPRSRPITPSPARAGPRTPTGRRPCWPAGRPRSRRRKPRSSRPRHGSASS